MLPNIVLPSRLNKSRLACFSNFLILIFIFIWFSLVVFSFFVFYVSCHALASLSWLYRAIWQKNVSPSSCVSIFLLSPQQKKNTIEIIYDVYFFSFAFAFAFRLMLLLLHFEIEKVIKITICDKKIAFAFDIVFHLNTSTKSTCCCC